MRNENPLTKNARKILILRLDRIGDMLLSTPAIRSVREALPSAHLTLVGSPYNAPVLQGWEAVDEIRAYDRKWPASRKREFARGLREERYDLCMVLSSLMESYRLAASSRARIRAGILYSRRLWARVAGPRLLTHPMVLDIDGAVKRKERVPHEVEQLLGLVRHVGLPAKEHPLEVSLRRADVDWARELVSRSLDGGALIGLHLSDEWLSGGWSGLGIAVLIEEILRGIPGSCVIVTHGPKDSKAAARVAPYLGREWVIAPDFRNRVLLSGDLPFGRWAALLSLCGAVVTRDTGSLHLAAALGRPVVAIYDKGRFHHNSQQWAPWMVPHCSLESGRCGETSAEILRMLKSLLADTARRAA